MTPVGAMPPACRICGRPFEAAPGRYHAARNLCARCYVHARHRGTLHRWPRVTMRGRAADVLEDVAYFATTGEAASQWPERVGMTPAALRMLLRRHGRKDLAREVRQAFPRA